MEINNIIFLSVVFFSGYLLQGITGFGAALFCLPFALLVIPTTEFVPIALLFTLLQSIIIVIKDYKYISWKQLIIIISLASIVGIPFGKFVIGNFSEKPVKVFLGFFILANSMFCLYNLYKKKNSYSKLKWYHYFLPIGSGCMQTAFGIGGPLLMMYLDKFIEGKREIRATACVYWIALNSLIIAQYYFSHSISIISIKLAIFLLPSMLFGALSGNIIIILVSQERFKKLMNIALIVSAIFLLVQLN